MSPKTVFDTVRARVEEPVVIINHPRGTADYFNYVGLDPVTGAVEKSADWDPTFTLIEVFNNSDWLANRDAVVSDWFTLLRNGRHVFAVGSSDSHRIAASPVGYPRTCIDLGTDDPRALTAELVRDRAAAGRSVVTGGIFVDAKVGEVGPGGTVAGAADTTMVDVTIRAATWIDVDAIDVVVDGVTVDTIAIMPGDTSVEDPTIRWHGLVPVEVAATGSFVVVAAYGDAALEPVHAGHKPFGVTNPIFLQP
jgi:hypothetical protein